MRVFLRNTKTRLLFAGPNRWAASKGEALAFGSVAQATEFALSHQMPETEILLRSDLLSQEIAMPVLPQWLDIGRGGATVP